MGNEKWKMENGNIFQLTTANFRLTISNFQLTISRGEPLLAGSD